MSYGTQLASIDPNTPSLLAMLKAELNQEPDSSIAPGGDSVLKVQLANVQRWLVLNYDFSDLRIKRDVAMVPGQRYYNFPQTNGVDDFDLTRKLTFECYWSNMRYPVDGGIGLTQYNTINPEINQRLDPVMLWQKYRNPTPGNPAGSNDVQFEVWPIPNLATTIRIWGQAKLAPLVQDTDKCMLDDLLIVQWAAARYLARTKSADAAAMLSEAQKTLSRLISGDNSNDPVFSLSGTSCRRNSIIRPTIAINYSTPQ